jgi:hypothetical protein
MDSTQNKLLEKSKKEVDDAWNDVKKSKKKVILSVEKEALEDLRKKIDDFKRKFDLHCENEEKYGVTEKNEIKPFWYNVTDMEIFLAFFRRTYKRELGKRLDPEIEWYMSI